MFTFNLVIDQATLNSFGQLPREVEQGLQKGVRDAMFFAERKAKERFGTPGNLRVRTGRLRQSIRSDTTLEGDTVVGSIGSNVVYAAIHELGGVVQARASKYLTFRTAEGDWTSATQVKIPARPYLQPAIEENWNRIEDIILSRLINSVKG